MNYKKKKDCLFVDFYDKFYSFYLDLKQLEDLKIIPVIDEIRIERINDDYFLIPYNYKYSHRIYDGIIYEQDDYLDKFRKTWASILGRVTNKDNRDYKNYGGRGIKLEFESFHQFYKELYPSYIEAIKKYPNEKISIDRIDVNKNYSKENIRWIPMPWQNSNRRQNKWIKIISPNENIFLTKNLFNFSMYMDMNYNTIYDNLIYQTNNSQGWKFEYIDIKDYENLPINEIDIIINITNYPNYKIVYKKEA